LRARLGQRIAVEALEVIDAAARADGSNEIAVVPAYPSPDREEPLTVDPAAQRGADVQPGHLAVAHRVEERAIPDVRGFGRRMAPGRRTRDSLRIVHDEPGGLYQ